MAKLTHKYADAPPPPEGETNAVVTVKSKDPVTHVWDEEAAPVPETHPGGHSIGTDPVTGKDRPKNALGQWLDEELPDPTTEELIRELPSDSMTAARIKATAARKAALATPTVSESVGDDYHEAPPKPAPKK